MAGIYLHIPFCKRKCNYCDFYSCVTLEKKKALIAALHHEMELRKGYLEASQKVETLYFGGGTPSLISPPQIRELIDHVHQLWPSQQGDSLREVTLEANPDDLNAEYLRGLLAAGVGRLSIGVQSFHDHHLRWMARRHSASAAHASVLQARRAGFTNLTIDLIYGLPGMRLGEWEENLQRAIDLGVEHLSAYHLSIEPGTELGRQVALGILQESPPEAGEEQYAVLREHLRRAGYEHYEISNFARPGFRALHNSHYWSGASYLGLGPSAHSYDGRSRCWNCSDLGDYLKGTLPTTETLSPGEHYNEWLLTRLRTAEGVDFEHFSESVGPQRANYFVGQTAKFISRGVIHLCEGRYTIDPEYFFISDSIIADLFMEE